MDVILYSKISKVNNELNGSAENSITGTKVSNISCANNATSYTSSSTTDTFYIPIKKGYSYVVELAKKEGQTYAQSVRVSISSNIPALNGACTYIGRFTIPQNVSNGSYSYDAYTDGYLAFSSYKDGGQYLATVTASEITNGVKQTTEKNNEDVTTINQTLYGGEKHNIPVTDFEIGSIYQSDGTNYDGSTYTIRTPNNAKAIVQADGTIVKSTNILIGTVYAFKYTSDGTFVERIGTSGVKSVEITAGYYRFVLVATNTSDVITNQTIPNYYADTVMQIVPSGGIVEELKTYVKADDVSNWEIGSIYSNNGTNYNENTHAVRTPNNSKIQVETETTFVCENRNIATVYAFKYDSSGTFIERYGSANNKSVTISAGYYRFVLLAVDSTVVITSETINNYSEYSAFISGEMGKLTGELSTQVSESRIIGSDYVIDSAFMKHGIKVTEIGQISGAQSFCVYNNKYYSCYGTHLYRQSASFTSEADASVSIGHGNALVLGSNGIAYASGWDDDKVYIVDLANMTVTDSITLPITGYTTCAVDDVNEIMYIFSRSDTTSTVDNWTFTVWDYANDNVLLTKKITNAFAAIQGVDFYNGRILVAWGLGTNVAPSGIAVYNTNGDMLCEYRATAISSNEPEGVCFDRATNRLLFSTITQKVFLIEPKV